MRNAGPIARIETYLVERGAGAAGINDDELADLIREESLDDAVDSDSASLDRYLRLVPDLENRLVALDAAIDVVLRRRSNGGAPDRRVVEELSGHYPHLADHIRDAAALSAGLVSSRGGRSAELRTRILPSAFGPLMDDGEPRYLLIERLGRGAHGEVFLAEDRWLADRTHRPRVAIKLLARGHQSERARQRLMDEAAKARRIDHPNVVRVYDRGVSSDGEDFIAYEYVPGGTLDAVLPVRSGTAWARDVVRLIASVARGVHAAHHAGLVHCDLKPGNVLIAEDGSPKVADFGVAARVVDPGDEVIRGTAGGPLGNLAFISPEQFREEAGSVAIPADLYALGGLLYYALTGDLPNGRTAKEIGDRHTAPRIGLRRDIEQRMTRQFDADLAAIAQRALADQPSDRFSSAAEFADELNRWADRKPVTTRPSTVVRRVHLWAKRRPAFAGVIVASLLLTGGSLLAAGREYRKQSTFMRSVFEARDLNDRVAFGANLLPMVWILEQVNGSSVLGREDFDEFVFSHRFRLLDSEIQRRHRDGQSDDVMTLIWEITYAHWVLQSPDSHSSMSHLLKESQRKWSEIVKPGDSMLVYVNMLCAVSEIRDAWFLQSAPDQLNPALRTEIVKAAVTIEDYLASLQPVEYFSPAHVLAVRALKHAYSGKLLNQSKKFADWAYELKLIELGHAVPRDPPQH